MKEAEFALRIEETMDLLHLRWHHEVDSRWSKRGLPDYIIVGPCGVMFLEIKSDKGKATPQQEAWVKELTEGGVLAYVAWPKDWDRVLSDLKRIAGKDSTHGHDSRLRAS